MIPILDILQKSLTGFNGAW